MTGSELIIALDHYDRHIPFFSGLVDSPPEFSLRALEVGMVPPRRFPEPGQRALLVLGDAVARSC